MHLPETVVETILKNLDSNTDRNSVSLVNKLWYTVDRYSRKIVHVSNCNEISPQRVIERFPNIRSLTLKAKHGLLCDVSVWVDVLSKNCGLLESLRFKRFVVLDRELVKVSTCFPKLKGFGLKSCSGFSIDGLKAIASNCENLEQFEVEKCDVTDNSGHWLRSFPETLTSLTSLNISCIRGAIDATDLSRLVTRCPNLTTLSLNKTVSANIISQILIKAPQIVHLGIGSTIQNLEIEILSYYQLSRSLLKCESIQSLAFFYQIPIRLIHAFYIICPKLVSVNLRFASYLPDVEVVNFLKKCRKLRRLSIRSCMGDEGLEAVSKSCKNLEELRVFRGTGSIGVTEKGLIAISTRCQKLKSLTYFCTQMTNAALVTFSQNCPNITCFKLIISTPNQPDHLTLQSFDHGYGAIVESCKNLKKLTISGQLTDDVFLYIGMYAERLEVLSVLNAGEVDVGVAYVKNGCKNLRKVEISNRPLLNEAPFLANIYA